MVNRLGFWSALLLLLLFYFLDHSPNARVSFLGAGVWGHGAGVWVGVSVGRLLRAALLPSSVSTVAVRSGLGMHGNAAADLTCAFSACISWIL